MNWFRDEINQTSLSCKEKAFDFSATKEERFKFGTQKYICDEWLTMVCMKKVVKDILFSTEDIDEKIEELNLGENEKKYFRAICLEDKSLLKRFQAMPKRYDEYSLKLKEMASKVKVENEMRSDYFSGIKQMFEDRDFSSIVMFAQGSVGLFKRDFSNLLHVSPMSLIINRGDAANKNLGLEQAFDELDFENIEWLLGELRVWKTEKSQNNENVVLNPLQKVCYKKCLDMFDGNLVQINKLKNIITTEEEKDVFIAVCDDKIKEDESDNNSTEKTAHVKEFVEKLDFELLPTE